MCIGKGLAEFFEHGIGKFFLILVVISLTVYMAYFTKRAFLPGTHPSDTIIAFTQDLDFVMGKNDADYKGYIRFVASDRRYAGYNAQQTCGVIIAVESKNDIRFTHAIEILLLNENQDIISHFLLSRDSFVLASSGYSRNTGNMVLSEPHVIEDIKYFSYHIIKE